jgi:2-amino-5-formylamino-6-ribosylaminopyrimidin-4(3H)-one 5'-monophosphate deformylase
LDSRKVGILALGSHEEKHGAALPLDTDAKLASHVALEATKRSGAKFLGVLYASYELPGIDTGRHQPLEQLVDELISTLRAAKGTLGIEGAVLVNGHGGNEPLRDHVRTIEQELGMRLFFNNVIVDLEGPHAATGELSMGMAVGITDTSKLAEHVDFIRYPEVGFVGLTEAQERYPWAKQHARDLGKVGIRAEKFLGAELLKCAIGDVVNNIYEL